MSENNPEPLPCSRCERDLDPRGYQQHLRQAHGVPQNLARQEFEAAKEGRQPLTASAGDNAGTDPSRSPGVPDGPTPDHLRDDPEIKQLEKEREKLKRQAEISNYQQMIGGNDDEFLDKLTKLREAGLLGAGPQRDRSRGRDGGGRESAAIRSELRALRDKLERGGQTDVSIESDGSNVLSTALAAGVDDPEVVEALAQSQPEAKRAEVEYQKERLKWDKRRELVDGVLGKLSEGDTLQTLIQAGSAVFASREGQQQSEEEPAQQPSQARQRGSRGQPGRGAGQPSVGRPERRGGREEPAQELRAPRRSPARQKVERSTEPDSESDDPEPEPEADEASPTGEFRDPPGEQVAATDGGDDTDE